ncbi:IclR family transcriptional regulator [Pseudonocardia sp. GCM10023141]|uniref:IclR family transcriptional regulator n=1 Tax=Pseudonocardia sp. GCM10023141 TaxID=3252653 RepID=UPI003623D536
MPAPDRAAEADERPPSPAVDRALTILETLVAADAPMTLTALAHAADVPLATCASIAQTLEIRGYASRTVVGRSHFWRPTLKLSGLAAQLDRKIDLSSLTQPFLRTLVDLTGMAAHVGVLEGTLVIYVAKVGAPGMVQFNTYPGKTAPFNLTALGRAVAAHLPEAALAPLLKRLIPGTGPNAVPVTPARMRAMLAEVRERGYAVEDEEEDAGIGCIAAPFFDAQGEVAGSIGVTGWVERVRGASLTEVVNAVTTQSALLSRELAAGRTP